MTPADEARISPSVARNRDPILAVMRRVFPSRGTVLEIASGTGEHAVHCAAGLPGLGWQPSDLDVEALRSIAAHRALAGLPNLATPIALDVCRWPWPLTRADIVVSINMIHIAPPEATAGLIEGAGRVLPPGGVLFLYGPFREAGRDLAPGNAAFDDSLKARDPQWGLRDLDVVAAVAAENGFSLSERIEMPANNLSLVFLRGG